jgi:fermentation-respiration switch protein FrsA (DUF1100 family)
VVTVMRTLLLVWILSFVAVALFQEHLVWHPTGPPSRTPASMRLPCEDLTLETSDGVRIEAWRIDAPDPKGALLYLHGNSGSIGNLVGVARRFRQMRWSVLLIEYRGYGNSGGSVTEEGTYLDAVAGYDALRAAGYPAERIVAWGHSLGGAVAVELARRRPLSGLVTESTFTSVPDVGAERFPWLPIRLLARIHYDSAAKAPGLDLPWLLIHGIDDKIVRYHFGERLFAAAQSGRAEDRDAAPLLFHATRHGHFGADLDDRGDREVIFGFLDAAVGAD